MTLALSLVALVLGAIALASFAEKLRVSPPLLLLAAGIVISFVPFIPDFTLNPEIVLLGVLPPLLYGAAFNTSFVDFRRNKAPVAWLSIGLVIVTTLAVGVAVHALVPDIPLALGFALGAVVAPPDAVAASAVARRVGMPHGIVQVLEGESLVNDATALTLLRTSIIALSGTVTAFEIGLEFVKAAGIGIVVGLAVAAVYLPIRQRIQRPVLDTSVSLLVPFVAYLPAESLEGSGVIAAVTAGLIVGHRTPAYQSGAARLAATSNWNTVEFVLESVVFLLIGLQLHVLVSEAAAAGVSIPFIVMLTAVVYVITVVVRILWVLGLAGLERLPIPGTRAEPRSLKRVIVVAWAGMRGVVTLAAALTLPLDVPYRPALVLCAALVTVLSLLIQGSTLPFLVRRLRLPAPDPAQYALQEAALLEEASRAGERRLAELIDSETDPQVVARLHERAAERSNAAWERISRSPRDQQSEPPSATYARLRLEVLEAERAAVLAARSDGRTDDLVLRRVIGELDIEEALLDVERAEAQIIDDEVRAPVTAAQCLHLRHIPLDDERWHPEDVVPVCPACVEENLRWVYLRRCLVCGYVGCCDSSPGRHASRHFADSAHPVIRSLEPGEAWRWCYVDDELG